MVDRDRKHPTGARDTTDEASAESGEAPSTVKRSPGRPPGGRLVAARLTVRVDEARHAGLERLASIHGRSVHSFLLEAIDDLLRKRLD